MLPIFKLVYADEGGRKSQKYIYKQNSRYSQSNYQRLNRVAV